MPNKSGSAYSLISFCPIKNEAQDCPSPVFYTRKVLQELPAGLDPGDPPSPMAKVPNTYLARFFILDDLQFQGYPHSLDKLNSKYLAFTASLFGELDPYLNGMWDNAQTTICSIWKYCVGFEAVTSRESFANYIKKCQVETTFFFNGSTDDSLDEQLKSLYLKQEFSKFAYSHQNMSAVQLLNDFKAFINRTQPSVLGLPTWRPGISQLDEVVEQNKN